jgi:hypothetical protein
MISYTSLHNNNDETLNVSAVSHNKRKQHLSVNFDREIKKYGLVGYYIYCYFVIIFSY